VTLSNDWDLVADSQIQNDSVVVVAGSSTLHHEEEGDEDVGDSALVVSLLHGIDQDQLLDAAVTDEEVDGLEVAPVAALQISSEEEH
jgi:hypothetical protein